jgi:hypothetical protein
MACKYIRETRIVLSRCIVIEAYRPIGNNLNAHLSI